MEATDGFYLSFDPYSTYTFKEVAGRRRYGGTHDEVLVKWSHVKSVAEAQAKESEAGGSKGSGGGAEGKEKVREHQMWLREKEIDCCCPGLLRVYSEGEGVGAETVRGNPSGVSPSPLLGFAMGGDVQSEALQEMADDVASLVKRAKRFLGHSGQLPVHMKGMLSNTINILSAYAKIGALAGAMCKHGALDLLLGLLSSDDSEVRRGARDMLCSLASHDAASRTYVLLQLIKDKDEEERHPSSENCRMLLDLFAEMSSTEECREHLLNEAPLPQVHTYMYVNGLYTCVACLNEGKITICKMQHAFQA